LKKTTFHLIAQNKQKVIDNLKEKFSHDSIALLEYVWSCFLWWVTWLGMCH